MFLFGFLELLLLYCLECPAILVESKVKPVLNFVNIIIDVNVFIIIFVFVVVDIVKFCSIVKLTSVMPSTLYKKFLSKTDSNS